jgi:hypothetical protein
MHLKNIVLVFEMQPGSNVVERPHYSDKESWKIHNFLHKKTSLETSIFLIDGLKLVLFWL